MAGRLRKLVLEDGNLHTRFVPTELVSIRYPTEWIYLVPIQYFPSKSKPKSKPKSKLKPKPKPIPRGVKKKFFSKNFTFSGYLIDTSSAPTFPFYNFKFFYSKC